MQWKYMLTTLTVLIPAVEVHADDLLSHVHNEPELGQTGLRRLELLQPIGAVVGLAHVALTANVGGLP